MKRCPDCQERLHTSKLVVRTEPRPQGWATYHGEYIEVWECPNVANHGKLVPCANGCGEDVPNNQFHYSYTEGALGSGRWSCFPAPAYMERLDFHLNPEKEN